MLHTLFDIAVQIYSLYSNNMWTTWKGAQHAAKNSTTIIIIIIIITARFFFLEEAVQKNKWTDKVTFTVESKREYSTFDCNMHLDVQRAEALIGWSDSRTRNKIKRWTFFFKEWLKNPLSSTQWRITLWNSAASYWKPLPPASLGDNGKV